MIRNVFIIFLLGNAIISPAQVSVMGKAQCGYSLSSNRTVLPSKFQYGGALALTWHYSNRLVGIAELGLNQLQFDNPYLEKFSMRYFSFGMGYDLLKQPGKCAIYVAPQLGGFTFFPDESNPFRSTLSRWRQSGVRIEANYFIRDWLGFSLTGSRFFPTVKNGHDFQCFVQAGVVFRTRNKHRVEGESNVSRP